MNALAKLLDSRSSIDLKNVFASAVATDQLHKITGGSTSRQIPAASVTFCLEKYASCMRQLMMDFKSALCKDESTENDMKHIHDLAAVCFSKWVEIKCCINICKSQHDHIVKLGFDGDVRTVCANAHLAGAFLGQPEQEAIGNICELHRKIYEFIAIQYEMYAAMQLMNQNGRDMVAKICKNSANVFKHSFDSPEYKNCCDAAISSVALHSLCHYDHKLTYIIARYCYLMVELQPLIALFESNLCRVYNACAFRRKQIAMGEIDIIQKQESKEVIDIEELMKCIAINEGDARSTFIKIVENDKMPAGNAHLVPLTAFVTSGGRLV